MTARRNAVPVTRRARERPPGRDRPMSAPAGPGMVALIERKKRGEPLSADELAELETDER